ncbi:MAG TPA: ribose 5-phosphate isomerase B [Cyclobacteriaceae bacterium]|nr:ribose 5-phosphate isomerase B [Cyclobacteriaceae bacterium]HRK54840.1 ribose 5-phosphate isomerase B [Cyclobacteriaceae bacterium]
MKQKIAIGSDHAGYEMKEEIKGLLQNQGLEITDFGANSTESADYPDFAHPVANAVEKGENEFGILICGSANGVAMTANKHQGIRAAICWNEELASLARQHNNANVLCLPARFIKMELAEKIVDQFLKVSFEGGRHERRVNKISC